MAGWLVWVNGSMRLKIAVSVVQFRPWAASDAEFHRGARKRLDTFQGWLDIFSSAFVPDGGTT